MSDINGSLCLNATVNSRCVYEFTSYSTDYLKKIYIHMTAYNTKLT